MSTDTQSENGQNKLVVTSSQKKFESLQTLFEKSKGSIGAILPKHLTPEQILKITLSAISRTPSLLECTAQSILMCVMQAAALGLPPNTPLGLSYLVPYGKTAQFIPGYRGLIRLAVQSGEVQQIWSRVVYARDVLKIEYGTDQKLIHIPCEEEDPGPVRATYAVAEMKNGSKPFELMWKRQIDAIRDRSPAGRSGPWVTDYDEMSRKTPVRRLCKSLPLSEEKLGRALEHAAIAEGGLTPDFGDVMDVFGEGVPDEATPTDGLRARLAGKASS